MKSHLVLFFSICSIFSAHALARDTNFNTLDNWVRTTKAQTAHESGTAIAVIKDGKMIHEAYFGYADIQHKQAVTRDTGFYIASATKPFTALNALIKANARLVDLNITLQDMFPNRVFPNVQAQSINAKDLLRHGAGIDNQALVWATAFSGVHSAATRRELIAQSIPNNEAPHGTFHYSNVGYNIVAQWLDDTLQTPWQDQLAETVFKPLKMRRTTARMSVAQSNNWPLALPYSFANIDPNKPLYLRKSDATMHAAGGMISTAPDLAKFLIAEINHGRVNKKSVFPKPLIVQSLQPIISAKDSYLDFARDGYALGWYTGTYKGHPMRHHFGSFAGFHAHLSFIPNKKIGLVVLNNEDMLSPRLTQLIADHVYDTLLNNSQDEAKPETQFTELIAKAKSMQGQLIEHRQAIAARAWHLTLAKEKYLGRYRHSLLGELTVTRTSNQSLAVHFGQLHANGTGFETPDSVRVELVPNSGEVIQFIVTQSQVTGLSLAGEHFRKVPESVH